MDPILERMRETRWKWANTDKRALAELELRIATACRKKDLISYSDLVHGVVFNVSAAAPQHQIDVHSWTEFDRALIGDFLGLISTRSYGSHGFMASAVVVEKEEGIPSHSFFKWMRSLGALPDLDETSKLVFWNDQVQKAQAYYQSSSA